jgi:cytochrome c peroxidase
MLGGLGALAAGTAYLFFGTAGTPQDTAKELGSKARGLAAAAEGKAGLRHSKEDYQKVYDRIIEMMEKEDHDGEYIRKRQAS